MLSFEPTEQEWQGKWNEKRMLLLLKWIMTAGRWLAIRGALGKREGYRQENGPIQMMDKMSSRKITEGGRITLMQIKYNHHEKIETIQYLSGYKNHKDASVIIIRTEVTQSELETCKHKGSDDLLIRRNSTCDHRGDEGRQEPTSQLIQAF